MSLFNINTITISGTVGGDPKVKVSHSGNECAFFSVCVTKSIKVGENKYDDKKIWMRINAFKTQASIAAKHLSKGSRVVITGTIDENVYTNPEGVEIKNLVIIADKIVPFEWAKKQEELNKNKSQESLSGWNTSNIDDIDDNIPF